jgi:catechol 2,3-dioxygenase-like lactoylglutathione lyase family enzyme
MNLTVSHTFVIVDDQEAALRFYRDVLGLQVRIDAALGDMRWLTVGPKSQPELEIGLVPPEMGHSPFPTAYRRSSQRLASELSPPVARLAEPLTGHHHQGSVQACSTVAVGLQFDVFARFGDGTGPTKGIGSAGAAFRVRLERRNVGPIR